MGSTLSVKTDVAKLSASKRKRTIEKVAKALTQSVDNFISVSESIFSITLVFDDTLLNEVKAMFAHYDILEVEDDLVVIIIHSPEEIIKTPGCAIAFYNQLARRHINIEDTVSCYTDTIVLVRMSDIGKAFNALTEVEIELTKTSQDKIIKVYYSTAELTESCTYSLHTLGEVKRKIIYVLQNNATGLSWRRTSRQNRN